MTTEQRTENGGGVGSSVGLARWDIDQSTGEAREWRLVAKEDIEGQEWTFPKGKRLRGFKDYRDGDWCVYAPCDYYNSRIFGVPESLLTVVRPAKRANGRHELPQREQP